MASTLEEILQALAAAIRAGLPAGAVFERNPAFPARIPESGFVALHDGDPGGPEVLMSPLHYVYEHRAEIDLLVEKAGAAAREATFDSLKLAVGAALAVDRTLGGLCDYVEAEAPAPLELPVDGGETLKAATIGVIMVYGTPDPLA